MLSKARERREVAREEVRQALIDAGREVFLTKPWEQVSLRMIAVKAGYSAPTVLNHFGSKEGLIFSICAEDFLRLRARFEEIARVEDPIDRLREIGLKYVEFALENPHHYRFMFMFKMPLPDPSELQLDRMNPDQDAYAFVKMAVTAAIATGRLRDDCCDPDTVAQMLWSSVHGLVSLQLTKGDDPFLAFRPVVETARVLVDVVIRGLLKA